MRVGVPIPVVKNPRITFTTLEPTTMAIGDGYEIITVVLCIFQLISCSCELNTPSLHLFTFLLNVNDAMYSLYALSFEILNFL